MEGPRLSREASLPARSCLPCSRSSGQHVSNKRTTLKYFAPFGAKSTKLILDAQPSEDALLLSAEMCGAATL